MTKDKLDIEPFRQWSPAGDNLLLIAGPCSAESERQVMNTAAQLIEHKINIFRAGIWKPRSKPYTFTGCGEKGIPWLLEVKREFHLPVVVEVMNADQLKLVLDKGIDYIWLGARTTINPYMMDEISEALHGCDIPVFIKNPISPDLNTWIGALERINDAGIRKIATVHRGFQSVYSAPLRNEPHWDLPIKLKCTYPDLPILCDPSHIAGETKYIEDIVKKALALETSGLMVEVHYKPSEALSDDKQQLTPTQFGKMLENVNFHDRRCGLASNTPEQEEVIAKINTCRQIIDGCNEDLIKVLAQRMAAVKEIGEAKRKLELPALQASRWRDVMNQCLSLADELGLSKELVTEIMDVIHKYSIKIQ